MKAVGLIFTCCICCFIQGMAQIGIGTALPNSSTVLDVQSSTKGMRVPLMSSVQRNAVGTPGIGLMVYDTDQRRLFIYDGNQWMPVTMGNSNQVIAKEATPPANAAVSAFGSAVDISGNFAIVGAPHADGKAADVGVAYIYRKQNGIWQSPVKLIANDGVSGDFFGASVAIDSPFAIVGAYAKDAYKGAAYIFTFNGASWNSTPAKIVAADGAAGDSLGYSVDITFNGGNQAIIGAPRNDNGGFVNAGASYIFSGSGSLWSLQQKLVRNAPQPNCFFGRAVTIDENYAVVGIPYDNVSVVSDQGSANIYHYSGSWNIVTNVTLPISNANAHFGSSVAMKAGRIVVGAPGYFSQGIASIFNTSGLYLGSVSPQLSTYCRQFGTAVSITDNYILVSDPLYQSSFTQAYPGAVFAYNSNGSFLNVIENPNAIDSQFGYSVAVSGNSYIISSNPFGGKFYFGNF